jgi:hypothetical protein
MDQVAQFGVITAVGNRPLERRIQALTEQAPHLRAVRRSTIRNSIIRNSAINADWDAERVAANRAVRPLQRAQRHQTAFTNGKSGNSKEGGTTDTAIGGKKGEE